MSVRSDLEQLIHRLDADMRGMDAEVIALLQHHERQVGALLRWLQDGEGDPELRFDYTEWLRIGAVVLGRESMSETIENLRRLLSALEAEEARNDGPEA